MKSLTSSEQTTMTRQTTAADVRIWRAESQNQNRVKNFWFTMFRGRTQRAEMSLVEPPVPVLKWKVLDSQTNAR